MPDRGLRAGDGVQSEVERELQALAEKAALACQAGHDWLVVVTAFDLGQCLWVGENALRLSDNPIENIRLRCREYQTVLDFGMRAFPEKLGALWRDERSGRLGSSLEDRTRTLYGSLWVEFDNEAYFGEAAALLGARLERNGLGRDALVGKRGLDAGCGGGRYTVALRKLGAGSVVGLDFGVRGIRDGRARVARAGVDGVTFCVGSVLEMPFDDGSFDFVMSNGVLHHTRDPFKGLGEMRRVMKPGGTGWLYLYNSDGVYWMVRKTMRRMVEAIPEEFAKEVLTSLGVLHNRLFLIMDSLYVPIEENYTREEVEGMLARAGFRRWRLLRRGADRDLSEAVHRGDPYAVEMYGVYGDLRFWLEG